MSKDRVAMFVGLLIVLGGTFVLSPPWGAGSPAAADPPKEIIPFDDANGDDPSTSHPGQKPGSAFPAPELRLVLSLEPYYPFTTVRHVAPEALQVPKHTQPTFSVRSNVPVADFVWTGARELTEERFSSTATIDLKKAGSYTVAVTAMVRLPGGRLQPEPSKTKSISITATNVNPRSVSIRITDPTTTPMVGHIGKVFRCHAETSPPGYEGLIEWTGGGAPASGLGADFSTYYFRKGRFALRAGPSSALDVDIYLVSPILRESSAGQTIWYGYPITFTATTDPPGFESHITWRVESMHDMMTRAEPSSGTGPRFTTTFSPTTNGRSFWAQVYAGEVAALSTPDQPPVPNTPSDLEITSVTTSEISMAWIDNADNETGFEVETSGSTAGPWSISGTLLANSTTFTNSQLSPATSRYFRVRALRNAASSMYSNVTGATTAPGGGCCNPNGSCVVSDDQACAAAAGFFGGIGSTCPDASCVGTTLAQIRRYQTVTPTVDVNYATNLASSLFGLTGTVSDDADAVRVWGMGDEFLAVYKASGGFLYENRNKLYDSAYPGPSLTEQQAGQFAADFLSQHGLMRNEAALLGARLIDATDPETESSVPNHWQVRYLFEVDARQGLGPTVLVPVLGAEIDVRVGNAEVVGLNWAWRDLIPSGIIQTYDIATAAGIANQAEGFRPELPISPLIAYNLQSPTEYQAIADARYIFPTRSGGDHGGGANIPASQLSPRVKIEWPTFMTFEEGQPITLTATIMGGTPPYQTVWLDAMGANASRGGDPAAPLSQQNPATFTLPHGNHLIQVLVTDANGENEEDGDVVMVSQDLTPPPPEGGIACPPQSPTILRKVVNGNGWSTVAEITANDGMRLNRLTFTGKKLAQEVSVPYYKLETALMPLTNCELKNPPPGTGNCQSHLMEPGIVTEVNPWFTLIQACYCVDHLPDGPVVLSGILYVCQDYLFRPKRTGCSPADWAECAPYTSYINYHYEAPPLAPGNILKVINTFHRFDYDVVTSTNLGGFFQDPDGLFVYFPRVVSSVMEEQSHIMADFGSPGDKDNYHQTDDFAGIRIPGCSGLTPISGLPGLGGGGWECSHIHYRWSAAFGADWGGGMVFPGSAQRVRDWVFRRHRNEMDPPNFDLSQYLCPPGVSPPCDPEMFETLLGSDLVLWEDVHGYLQADSFTAAHRFFR